MVLYIHLMPKRDLCRFFFSVPLTFQLNENLTKPRNKQAYIFMINNVLDFLDTKAPLIFKALVSVRDVSVLVVLYLYIVFVVICKSKPEFVVSKQKMHPENFVFI